MTDPRAGIGGYVQDAVAGGYQLGRAKQNAATVRWVGLLVGEPGDKQRPVVLGNRQVIDRWKQELNPLGVSVGAWVVHGTDPVRDAQHYQGYKHLDLAVCNCEREYVEDPSRSRTFLEKVGPMPPMVLSTNGNPAQKPMDYRRWEKRGAWLATQAYWQFNVVSYLTPRVAHQLAYLPEQVNVGPSDTSWWYRVWLRGRGNRWTQSAGTVGVNDSTFLTLEDGQTNSRWHARTRRGSDGGLYLTDRVLLANGTRDVGRVLGFFPKLRITAHISNENGDTGRPSPQDVFVKVSACPTRKQAVGVFTLDNMSDDELAAISRGVAA